MSMNDYAQIALAVFRVVLTILAVVLTSILIPWLRHECIPWLKERRLYTLVSMFVQAAEKFYEYSENAGEDKKQYVIDALRDKGYEITDEVEAYIESAVEELDLFTMSAVSGIANTFVDDEEDLGDDEDDDTPDNTTETGDVIEEREVSED